MKSEFIVKARDRAITWARDMLKNPNAIILDTETTGLGGQDEVIELAILGIDGNGIMNERFMPRCEISEGAYEIHGISLEQLVKCPNFQERYHEVEDLILDKAIIIYNARFDSRTISQSLPLTGSAWADEADSIHCAMEKYAEFTGEWNASRHSFKWQRLPGGDHSAMGDCQAVLDLISMMANTRLSSEENNEQQSIG